MEKLSEIEAEYFWNWCKEAYLYKENKDALLYLQDELNINVNMVLLLYFVQSKYVSLNTSEINQLLSALQDAEKATNKLREARRSFSSNKASTEYKHALALELNSECTQQTILIRTLKALFNAQSINDILENEHNRDFYQESKHAPQSESSNAKKGARNGDTRIDELYKLKLETKGADDTTKMSSSRFCFSVEEVEKMLRLAYPHIPHEGACFDALRTVSKNIEQLLIHNKTMTQTTNIN